MNCTALLDSLVEVHSGDDLTETTVGAVVASAVVIFSKESDCSTRHWR